MSSLTPAVSTSSTPFFVIPASHPPSSARFPIPATVQHYRPSFPIESVQRPAATAATAAAAPVVAHKHAHHLHSIPPKQKSTKSLIIDHLLWSHTRTRLAQIAAQLGVAELEQEEENDDEEVLEEEQVCSRMGYGQQQRQQRQQPSTSSTQRRINLVQARALKARADGFERVLAAMLASSSSSSSPENLFPEHVRFRITLGTLIHDLFNPPSATTLSTAVVAPTTITNGSQQQQSGSEGGVTKEKKQRKKTKHVPECFRAMSSRRPAFSSSPISPTSSSSSPSSSFPLNTTLANQHSRAQQLFNAGVASHHHQSRCTRHFSQTCEVCIPSTTRPVVSVNGIGSGLSNPTNGKPFGLSILHERTNEEGARPCFEALRLFLQLSAFMMQEISREAAKAQHNDEGEESEDEDEEEEDETRSVVSSSSGSFTSVESGTQHGGSSTRPASRNASHDEMDLDVVVAAKQQQQQENWSSLPSLLPSSNKLVKRRPEGEKKKQQKKKTLSFAFPSFSTTTKPSTVPVESIMDVPAAAVESEVWWFSLQRRGTLSWRAC
ncbi:hypothetical protein FRB91_011049 [Serendipita sp. 411]|nr:hypothetical protein FRB91_011049 [Serendipita sp. 411]